MKATIELNDLQKNYYTALLPEKTQTIRAQTQIEHTDGITQITITATDSTALRALFNGISKQITVMEKMEKI